MSTHQQPADTPPRHRVTPAPARLPTHRDTDTDHVPVRTGSATDTDQVPARAESAADTQATEPVPPLPTSGELGRALAAAVRANLLRATAATTGTERH
ncbi:hypothetical protein AAHZ94_20390 [Streptomyces sp. HSW2009]|uniref:hypothetical protein n=1 Tax=Streptomyces sp. HSW2009 TaxID=3142890 RepID=UPI0032ECE372